MKDNKGKLKTNLKIALLCSPIVLSTLGLFSFVGTACALTYSDADLNEKYSAQEVIDYKNEQLDNLVLKYNNQEITRDEFLDQTKYWSSSESNEEAADFVYKEDEEYKGLLKKIENLQIATGTMLSLTVGGIIVASIEGMCLDHSNKKYKNYRVRMNEDENSDENNLDVKLEEDDSNSEENETEGKEA